MKHLDKAALCFLFIQVSKAELSPEALSSLRTATGYQGNTLSRVRISGSKPNFEVGSSSQLKLSFGKKTPKPGRFINPDWMKPCIYLDNPEIVKFILK